MGEEDDYDSPWNTWNGTQSSANASAEDNAVTPSFYDKSKSFEENGGDSLTALSSLLEMRKQGQNVTIEDFFTMNNGKSAANSSLASKISFLENNVVFKKEEIRDIPVDEAATLIAQSFVKKGDLEKARDDLEPKHFEEVVKRAWSLIQDYSFGFRDEAGKLRAVATIADIVDLEQLSFDGLHEHLQEVFPYLNYITEKVMDQMPDAHKKGVILEKFMFGTAIENSPAENVILMNMLEHEFHERARKAGYKVSIAQNASPLTQQLAELMGCKRLITDDPRVYVNDKEKRPFLKCVEPTRITVDMMVYEENA